MRINGIQSKVHVEGLTWQERWIIYSEIREKGTVELGVEGNARDTAQHIYILSHLSPLNPAK